jgi:hypothetical protein
VFVARCFQFVLALVARLASDSGWDPLARALWVRDSERPATEPAPSGSAGGQSSSLVGSPIIDLGVYTRNRAMRLYLCCKYGRQQCLMPSASNAFALGPPDASPSGEKRSKRVQLLAVTGLARPVQTGDIAWERAIWDACFVTPWQPPEHLLPLGGGGGGGEGAQRQSSCSSSSSSSEMPFSAPTSPKLIDCAVPVSRVFSGCVSAFASASGQQGSTAASAAGSGLSGVLAMYNAMARGQTYTTAPPLRASSTPAGAASSDWESLKRRGGESRGESGWTRVGVVSPFPPIDQWVLKVCGSHGGPAPRIRVVEAVLTRVLLVPTASAWLDPASPLRVPASVGDRAGSAADTDRAGSAADTDRAGSAADTDRAGSAAATDRAGSAAATDRAGSAAWSQSARRMPEETHLVSKLLFSMSNNRYCAHIGRQHRSNNVVFVVDLEAGTCTQQCTDVECRGWRSPVMRLPEEIVPDQVDEGMSVSVLAERSPVRHRADPGKSSI